MFWKDTAERTLSTMAQVFLGAVGSDAILTLFPGVPDVWALPLAVAIAAGLAVLKAQLARQFGDPESASLVE